MTYRKRKHPVHFLSSIFEGLAAVINAETFSEIESLS
jgi:hypothetical protein